MSLLVAATRRAPPFDRYNIVNEQDLREASVRVTDYVADREPREWTPYRDDRQQERRRKCLMLRDAGGRT